MSKIFFDDADWDGQFGRTLYAALSHSADLGEAFATAGRIIVGDTTSWYDEWRATGERVAAEAAESAEGGHRVSARDGFLRAAEYYRQAFFYVRDDLEDPRLLEAYDLHRAAFRNAVSLMDGEARAVSIPYETTTLNAYFFRPADDDVARPTVLMPAGYDSTAECGWGDGVAMALERGFNALTFEGPGQGGVLYTQGLTFRPDFEHVVSPVVDFALAQRGVDPAGLILFGRSFAGYLAPRAATAEHRLAALICDPVQYDFAASVHHMLGDDGFARLQRSDSAFDAQLQDELKDPVRRNWMLSRMVTHGAATVGDYLRELSAFSLVGIAEGIICPTLLLDTVGDPSGNGQCDQLAADLRCPVTVHRFTAEEGAGGHCEGLGQRRMERVVFDWLDDVFSEHTITATSSPETPKHGTGGGGDTRSQHRSGEGPGRC